ncbi:uncharacterized protein DS421_15g521500 [Arachis hypogaea]|nr:uncharacterized protein DS421_15g521500 [Arachis hypogaea]
MLQPTRYIYSVRRQQNMLMHDRIVPYLERAGLYHLARLNARWLWLDDPLVNAFIERWRPETHAFHMPFGECTITLVLLDNATYGGDCTHICTGLDYDAAFYSVFRVGLAISLHVSGGQQKRDKLGRGDSTPIPSHWLPGISAQWATYLLTSDCKEERVIQCRLALDRLGDRDIVWEHYASLDVMAVVHPEILTEEHSRGLPQLGGIRHEPEPASNIDWLHAKDERGGGQMVPELLSDFQRWWYRVALAHRFLLPDSLIADPRAEEISQDVVQRGSSQVPSRVPMPDVPDNRRVEMRRRIGVAFGGPGNRPTEQAGAGSQEVPLTHVSSSQIYHEIHRQMYHDLAGPTFTMDMDHQVGSSQFYSDFAYLIRDDDPPHSQHQTLQDQVPETQPQIDVAQGYRPDMEEIQRYQPQMYDPQGYQPQFHVDLNEPASSSYHSWLGMGGTPPSAYVVGMPVDPLAQQRQRPARVRRAARCGTGRIS